MADIYRVLFGQEEIYNLRDRYVPIHRQFENIFNLNGISDITQIEDAINDVVGDSEIIYYYLIVLSLDYLMNESEIDYLIDYSINLSLDCDIEVNVI